VRGEDNIRFHRGAGLPYSLGNSVARMKRARRPANGHQLGRAEAERRIKSGLATVRTHYSALFHIQEENWTGDRLLFNISTLGQSASGLIDFADDHVRLEVTLPWLLALIAEKLTPAIRKEATLMLEKK